MEKAFKYLGVITGLFVAVLLISNIAAVKIIGLGPFAVSGGVIIFPISYIFGDILTEVYGYKRSRQVIWIGFFSALLMSLVFIIVGKLPPAIGWPNQMAYDAILGLTPRIVAASLIAYFAGEFLNSFVLAKMKIITNGRWLWMRTISSTIVGEFVDTLIFVVVSFAGVLPPGLVISIIISNYIFKTGIEIILTPATYRAVTFLKKREEEDYYDRDTNFNPFDVRA